MALNRFEAAVLIAHLLYCRKLIHDSQPLHHAKTKTRISPNFPVNQAKQAVSSTRPRRITKTRDYPSDDFDRFLYNTSEAI